MPYATLRKIVDTTYNDEGEETERTVPAMVNTEKVRCFYPRKLGKPGTRITFLGRRRFCSCGGY